MFVRLQQVVGTRRVDGRVFFCLFGVGGDDNVP